MAKGIKGRLGSSRVIGRSENMRRIRSKDTAPELAVRRAAYAMGYRYRLHRRDLPGSPDLVFAGRKKVVFVHGCFWHQHGDCREGRLPRSNTEYWTSKLERNVARDRVSQATLVSSGWAVLVVWECETVDNGRLRDKLAEFLG